MTSEDLGGASTHTTKSGVAHFTARNDRDCLESIRKLLSYIPSNNLEDPPCIPTDDPADRADPELAKIVPENPENVAV